MTQHADVVVVGAGPTGLLLAGDLAESGHSVVVIDSSEQRSKLTRAFAVHARTLEMLDMRGLAEQLIETGEPVSALQLFGNIQVDLFRLQEPFPVRACNTTDEYRETS